MVGTQDAGALFSGKGMLESLFFCYNTTVNESNQSNQGQIKCVAFSAWKVSKYEFFSAPYFPAFGPEKTPYLDTFLTAFDEWI